MEDEKKILELFSLDGKVAIVTGGAGRLGVKHCEILQKAGAIVVSFDVVGNKELDGIAEQVRVDITDLEKVRTAVAGVVENHGGIHILINNAALNPRGSKSATEEELLQFKPYEEYSPEMWDKEIAVGLTGAQFSTQAVAQYMMKQKSGCIVNIASTSAITVPNHSKYEEGKFKSVAYPTIKTALLGLTRAWASYFAATSPGIRVNSVSFGALDFGSKEKGSVAKASSSNMLGRRARADEYQGVILFLCSDAASFITASNVVVDGGQTAW